MTKNRSDNDIRPNIETSDTSGNVIKVRRYEGYMNYLTCFNLASVNRTLNPQPQKADK